MPSESVVCDRNGIWPKEKYRAKALAQVRFVYLTPEEREEFKRSALKQRRRLARKGVGYGMV